MRHAARVFVASLAVPGLAAPVAAVVRYEGRTSDETLLLVTAGIE